VTNGGRATGRSSLCLCASVVCFLWVLGVSTAAQQPTIRVGFLQSNGRYRVQTLDLEDYVARVLGGEAAPHTPPAALEALAITVRTYAAANAGRHAAEGFDMCDQTHCQVVGRATPDTFQAARATAGEILFFQGRPASVYYSASCGGHTELPSAVWPGAEDPPYLPSRPDEACRGEPSWTVQLSDADLLRALRSAGFSGSRLVGLTIASHDSSGRVAELAVDGLRPGRITGQDLRTAVSQTLGPSLIKSALFDLRQVRGGYVFSGHGSGHGVGLCVLGSANLATAGETAAEILSHYFPGTRVGGAPGAGAAPARPTAAPATPVPGSSEIAVTVPAGEESERAALARTADEVRREVAAALGVPAPAPLTVRVHATNESFEQATGRPWYGLSAVVAGEVHLPALSALEDRGLLVPALRRAVARLLVDGPLAGRPEWVREGLAIYFSRPNALPAGTSGDCPPDVDLIRPVSPGALAAADDRAAACVARQLRSGRNWREIR
jgi:stage II sporulation protein D (peptidoglycan lytic transglycosylase)